MRWGIAVLSVAAGLLVALVVGAVTDPGITICVDVTFHLLGGGASVEAWLGSDLLLEEGRAINHAAT